MGGSIDTVDLLVTSPRPEFHFGLVMCCDFQKWL